jgi:hypothetical protein
VLLRIGGTCTALARGVVLMLRHSEEGTANG